MPDDTLDTPTAPLSIGIVGCSAEGAALCYRTICTEGEAILGKHAHPDVVLHTHSLADYVAALSRGDLAEVGALMLSSAARLEQAGAELLVCPDNTIHAAWPLIEGRMTLPWLHIADVVAEEARRRGFRKVALTGTRWLVESEVYPERLAARGIALIRPEEADKAETDRIIMEELVRGRFRPGSIARFHEIVAGLGEDGAEAVILGCTELPLIMPEADAPLPVLDSTRLLARAALFAACEGLPGVTPPLLSPAGAGGGMS